MESVHEEWRAIPGHTGYEVSNCGRVRSLPRVIRQRNRWGMIDRRWPGQMLAAVNIRGYLVVKLGGKCRCLGVHQLVALAFLGPMPTGAVVNHVNGIKTDNDPRNLEWTTNRENVLHAYRTGLLSNRGTTNGRAVITEDQAKEIVSLMHAMKQIDIARRIGCRPNIVQDICCGKTWKHIPRLQTV